MTEGLGARYSLRFQHLIEKLSYCAVGFEYGVAMVHCPGEGRYWQMQFDRRGALRRVSRGAG